MNVMEIRKNGIGSNFQVLNPEDGFRKDNRLWFGECATCGEGVTNSSLIGVWEHTIYTLKEPGRGSSYNVDYCPKA